MHTYHGPSGGAAAKIDNPTAVLGNGHMDVLVAKNHLIDVVLQMQPIR